MGFISRKSVPEITMGNGASDSLAEICTGRTALIIDAYLAETEYFKRLTEEIFKDRDYKIICRVETEPSYEAIDPYIPVIRSYRPDHIAAIGGGSAMDTAKALWMFYELEDISWEQSVSEPLPPFPGKARLIAVPTTSGTGSEVTGAAVYKAYNNLKTMIISNEIRPGHAVLDYDLLGTLPPEVIACAGVDALAHVVGAISCKAASELDKLLGTAAAVRIIKALPRSFQGDDEARKVMHICACLAGDVMNNAGGGLEHKLDRFAKEFHLPHGLVIGIFLPYTMRYLIRENHYLEMAEQLGLEGSDQEKQEALIDRIWQIYDLVGVPRTLKQTGIPEKEFISSIPEYIRQVKEIGHIYWIQGFGGDEDLEALYRQAYYGI